MANHSSATARTESPHLTNPPISLALKRRAQSIINNKSIDAGTRAVIRYGLEISQKRIAAAESKVEAEPEKSKGVNKTYRTKTDKDGIFEIYDLPA